MSAARRMSCAQRSKTPIKKLIYVSTVALIGTPDANRVVDEDHPVHPADNYQWSKLHAEQLILRTMPRGKRSGSHSATGRVLRPAGVVCL